MNLYEAINLIYKQYGDVLSPKELNLLRTYRVLSVEKYGLNKSVYIGGLDADGFYRTLVERIEKRIMKETGSEVRKGIKRYDIFSYS